MDPELGRFDPFLGQRVLAMGDVSGHPLDTHAGQGGGARRGNLAGKISRPTVAGNARIGPANAVVVATLGSRILLFFDHSGSTHTSLPPFLDPLNSFPWFFYLDSSPFERYDENKFGRRLDRVFWPPQQLKVRILLCSWSLGLSVDINFVNFVRHLVSFPFLGHLG